MSFRITELQSPDDPLYAQAIRLYRQTQPKRLRDDDDNLAYGLTNPDPENPTHFLVATDSESGKVAGYAVCQYVKDANLGFLAYLGSCL